MRKQITFILLALVGIPFSIYAKDVAPGSLLAQTSPAALKPMPVASPQEFKSAVNTMHQTNQKRLTNQLNQQLAQVPPPPTQKITPPAPAPAQPVQQSTSAATQSTTTVTTETPATTTTIQPVVTVPAQPTQPTQDLPVANTQPLPNTKPPSSILYTPSPATPSNTTTDVYNGFQRQNQGTTNGNNNPSSNTNWNINY